MNELEKFKTILKYVDVESDVKPIEEIKFVECNESLQVIMTLDHFIHLKDCEKLLKETYETLKEIRSETNQNNRL